MSGSEIHKRGAMAVVENMKNKPNLKKLDLNCKFVRFMYRQIHVCFYHLHIIDDKCKDKKNILIVKMKFN